MGAKDELKKLISGEIPAIIEGTFYDPEKKRIYELSGNIGIYRGKKPKEDVSKLKPISLIENLKKDNVLLYLPSNGRETQRN